VGITLGLGAALSWGLADYFVALAARSAGALRVALAFHLAALIPLTALVLATDALANVTPGEVMVYALLGAAGWLSYLAFYRALAIGPISLLSPIVSGYAAVTVVLAVLIAGERLSAVEGGAVLVTIAGVIVVSADVSRIPALRIDRRAFHGVALAIAAMVLFGGFVFGISYERERIGWLAPIFLARGFTAAFLILHSGRRGSLRWRDPSPIMVLLIVLIALLDTGGYVLFNFGVGHAQTSLVATASAPYALVPVLMGTALLSERLSRTQWAGIAIVCGGLVLIGAAA
jgi:drug/metabolite transporter (DMT)-like permease